jgi:hypothetical protein
MDESEQREIQDQEQAYQEYMQAEDQLQEDIMDLYTYGEDGFSDGFTKI